MTAPAPEIPPCPCPTGEGRRISNPVKHAAWHKLVEQQGGPAGEVNIFTLRESRVIGRDR